MNEVKRNWHSTMSAPDFLSLIYLIAHMKGDTSIEREAKRSYFTNTVEGVPQLI